MTRISVSIASRAAVAGNPSDGFGGAVCSVVVPFFAATATASTGGSVVDEDPFELVSATRARFERSVQPTDDVSLQIETSIPRSVGLAGSSAIVIAVLRALDQHVGSSLTTMEIARLAHQIERSDLGIAGGWQDQLMQSHGASGLMEFSGEPKHNSLAIPEPPIPVYLAWSEAASEASGAAHTDLRKQRDSSDPVWAELAVLARRAAQAIAERNVHELKQAIDETFTIRQGVMDIAPSQRAMVEAARSFGASANFAGSGGAILGVLPKDGQRFLGEMRNVGYDIETWSLQ